MLPGGRLLGALANAPLSVVRAALIAVESGIFAIGAGLRLLSSHGLVEPRREGLLVATAAGARLGVAAVAVKYLAHAHILIAEGSGGYRLAQATAGQGGQATELPHRKPES